MDKIVANLNFHSSIPLEELADRMAQTADALATAMDCLHTCDGACSHGAPELHVRVNDSNTGKGTDHFYTRIHT